jgi:hypothetical protein
MDIFGKSMHKPMNLHLKHTYATFHGSGPRTLKYVRGFIVPAPTCSTRSKEKYIKENYNASTK